MNNNTSVVVFTFRRALQLDAFIETTIKNFPYLKLPIHIIYHYDQKHKESYDRLFNKWRAFITVHQRSPKNFLKIISLLRPLNLLWYIKFKWLREYYDDFKKILIDILYDIESDFILLSTDDQIIYKNTYIHQDIFKKINDNPKNYTMRLTSNYFFKDININKIVDVKNINEFKYLYWKSNKQINNTYWKYRFNVDGTIFQTKALLNFIKSFIFNMPTTLESIGLWESRFRNYFNHCYGTYYRTFIGLQLSNIQKTIDTPAADFDIDNLMKLYNENFLIDTDRLEIDEEKYIFIPNSIPLIKNGKKYFLNENGKLF